MKRKLLKWLCKKLRYSCYIQLQNRYHPGRVDTIDLVDLAFCNHKQQEAIEVWLPYGEKIFAQPKHYLNYE